MVVAAAAAAASGRPGLKSEFELLGFPNVYQREVHMPPPLAKPGLRFGRRSADRIAARPPASVPSGSSPSTSQLVLSVDLT